MSKSIEEKRRKKAKLVMRQRTRRALIVGANPTPAKLNRSVERKLIRDHQDVLQNIEFALVTAARQSEDVDDCVCDKVLRLAIAGKDADSGQEQQVLIQLAGIRQLRSDISDSLWRNALQVVHASVRNHSRCRPNDRNYLSFVSQYVI